MDTLLIQNGTLIDGTGRPGFAGDVLVEGDRIVAAGPAIGAAATRVIDATGKVVCPGFVDVHSHADLNVHSQDHPRLFEPLVRQGITTFVGGNCGFGLAPIDRGQNLAAQRFYLDGVTTVDLDQELPWTSVGGYLDHLEQRKVALNVALLCPHGLVRLQVMGQKIEQATDDELDRMGEIVKRALEEGAVGVSTGLQYFPGLYSDTRELVRLGAALKPFDARFTVHLRSYTRNTVAQAIDEAAEVGRVNEVHVQISHLFTLPWMGRHLNGLFMFGVKLLARHHKIANALVPGAMVSGDMARVVDQLEAHRRQGLRLGVDLMPTTTGFTHMLAFFPPWVMEGSTQATLARLRDPATRARIVRDIEHGEPVWPHRGHDDWSINFFRMFGYDCAVIMAVGSKRNKRLEGMRLVEIAKERGVHPAHAAMDLLIEENRQVLVFGSPAEPEDPFTVRSQYPALVHPEVSIATDTILLGFGRPSYLFYGCYPRFLGFHVREKRLLGLEAAIRKCTSLPAEQLGLKRRGRIAPGTFADLLVLDPGTISMEVDFQHPDRTPSGIEVVVINGRPVLEGGRYDAGALAGKVLRRGE